ncbi:MAG TPA: hypothetical protein VFN55_12695 [Solirubrobacteraceae bacterium]|nr:hypothetical protein [Solirubrobacteraceae bacterium]
MLDATWWAQIALIGHDLHLSSTQLAVALAGAPAGLLCAVRLVPPLVARGSSATVLARAIAFSAVALGLIGAAGSLVTLTAALVLFGLGNGTIDITVNVQAVALERILGRPVMSRLHAMWSLGTLLGGLGGSAAIALGATPGLWLTAVAVVMLALGSLRRGALLGPEADAAAPRLAVPGPAGPRMLSQPGLIVLGAIAFSGLFAEGAVSNWAGVLLHQVRHASFGVAALGAAAFGTGMLCGRLTGDRVLARAGRRRTLGWAGSAAAVMMAVVALVPSGGAALAGLVVLGGLLATVVPTAFSLTAAVPGPPPAWTISRLTTIGYAGSFAGPVVVGAVAGASRLTVALLIPALLLLAIAPAARMTRGRLAGSG